MNTVNYILILRDPSQAQDRKELGFTGFPITKENPEMIEIENLEAGDVIEIPLRFGKIQRILPAIITGVARRGGNAITIEAKWLDTGESFRFFRARRTILKKFVS